MSEEDTQDQKDMVYHHLSDQAVGAIAMALQKSMLATSEEFEEDGEKDVRKIIKDFALIETDDGLVVNNPPDFNIAPKEDGGE